MRLNGAVDVAFAPMWRRMQPRATALALVRRQVLQQALNTVVAGFTRRPGSRWRYEWLPQQCGATKPKILDTHLAAGHRNRGALLTGWIWLGAG